jgi:hypothetical protein
MVTARCKKDARVTKHGDDLGIAGHAGVLRKRAAAVVAGRLRSP